MLGAEWTLYVQMHFGRLIRYLGRVVMVRSDTVDCWCQQRHCTQQLRSHSLYIIH